MIEESSAEVVFAELQRAVLNFRPPSEPQAVSFRVPDFVRELTEEVARRSGRTVGEVISALYALGSELCEQLPRVFSERIRFNNALRTRPHDVAEFVDVTCEIDSLMYTMLLREALIAQQTTRDQWLTATLQALVWAILEAGPEPLRLAPPVEP